MWEKRDEPGTSGNLAGRPSSGGPPTAQIGKALRLQAEIRGGEDLYVDGEVVGRIELEGKDLTIGPNGRVAADVVAQSVTVLGRLEGNVRASDCVELRKTGSFQGEVVTARIVVEDGALFRGSVDIVKPGQEPAAKPNASEKKPAASEAKPAARKSGAA
jgi:cytoskeletal protein CcmA (bactofilin family)